MELLDEVYHMESPLPNLIPNATLFCRNDMIWLQEGVLTQPSQVFVAIYWIFATQFVLWP